MFDDAFEKFYFIQLAPFDEDNIGNFLGYDYSSDGEVNFIVYKYEPTFFSKYSIENDAELLDYLKDKEYRIIDAYGKRHDCCTYW